MKSVVYFLMAIAISLIAASSSSAQNSMKIEDFTRHISKGIPAGFKQDESGTDKKNLYAVYKKSPQEVISVNLQKDYRIEFPKQETTIFDGRKTIFYYAGFDKSAGLVVFLKNDAGYLVFGYNKPYMGEEIVKKSELLDIVKKIDLTDFE